MRQTDADVVQDGGKRQLLLSALALAMTAKIEAERGDADIGQASSQAGEEAALLAGDAPAVYQQDGTRRWLLGSDEGSCKVEPSSVRIRMVALAMAPTQ